MDQQSLNALTLRSEALERQNRWMKRAGAIACMVLMVSVAVLSPRRLLYRLAMPALIAAGLTVPLQADAQSMTAADSCRLKTNGSTASYTITSGDSLAVCVAQLAGLNRPFAGLNGQRWSANRVSPLDDSLVGEPVCWTTDSAGREWVVWELSIVAYRTVALGYCKALIRPNFLPLLWSAGAAGSGATSETIVFALMNGWTPPPFSTNQDVENAAQQYVATLEDICRQQLPAVPIGCEAVWQRAENLEGH